MKQTFSQLQFWCLKQCLAKGRYSINICWVNYFTTFYKYYIFNVLLDIPLRMCHRFLKLSKMHTWTHSHTSLTKPTSGVLCISFWHHHIHPRTQVRNRIFLPFSDIHIKLIPKSHWFKHARWLVFLPKPLFTLWLSSCSVPAHRGAHPSYFSPASLWLILEGSAQG